ETKKAKPWVKVGISPFGIWKPGFPPGIEGFNQYEKLYADAKLWLNEGWVDYWTPQLYWPIAQEKQSYPKLLKWWAEENTHKRHLWPGNYTSRVSGEAKGWPAKELSDQVLATRNQPGATGNVHFSMKALLKNTGGVADELKKVYGEPALVPASPWLGDKKPGKPAVSLDGQTLGYRVAIKPTAGEPARHFVVRALVGGKWQVQVLPATGKAEAMTLVPAGAAAVVVSGISRTGVEGEQMRVKP
ncbi:MAG TPA: family 10 glycosylhydrolase, partial [Gemmataceae bacterium]|nr:family 10 glycosylhydrolase [Gemmataceae bacterium]